MVTLTKGLDPVRGEFFIKGSLGLVLMELAWECSLSLGSVSLSKFRELKLLSVSPLGAGGRLGSGRAKVGTFLTRSGAS